MSSWEDHRSGYNDMEWAGQQPRGKPNYYIGDVVRFHVGGVGVIREVSRGKNGWPSSYATQKIEGFDYHAWHKDAWHYEGDFAGLVGESPLRKLKENNGKQQIEG
jgi:hypothetical protein